MTVHTYEELIDSLTAEEAIILMSYLKTEAQKINVSHYQNSTGSQAFDVPYSFYIKLDTIQYDEMFLSLDANYHWSGSKMSVRVDSVILFKSMEELDLVRKAESLMLDYVHQPD